MENDKVFDLIEKMYSEMQKGFLKVNERLENVENETGLIRNETGSLRNEVLKTNMKIENDIIPKIQVLFDANTQNQDRYDR